MIAVLGVALFALAACAPDVRTPSLRDVPEIPQDAVSERETIIKELTLEQQKLKKKMESEKP